MTRRRGRGRRKRDALASALALDLSSQSRRRGGGQKIAVTDSASECYGNRLTRGTRARPSVIHCTIRKARRLCPPRRGFDGTPTQRISLANRVESTQNSLQKSYPAPREHAPRLLGDARKWERDADVVGHGDGRVNVGAVVATEQHLTVLCRVLSDALLDLGACESRRGRSATWSTTGAERLHSRKCLSSPCTGHAAASPNAQIVCPSISLVNSWSISISRSCARPTTRRSIIFSSQVVPSRQGVH